MHTTTTEIADNIYRLWLACPCARSELHRCHFDNEVETMGLSLEFVDR